MAKRMDAALDDKGVFVSRAELSIPEDLQVAVDKVGALDATLRFEAGGRTPCSLAVTPRAFSMPSPRPGYVSPTSPFAGAVLSPSGLGSGSPIRTAPRPQQHTSPSDVVMGTDTPETGGKVTSDEPPAEDAHADLEAGWEFLAVLPKQDLWFLPGRGKAGVGPVNDMPPVDEGDADAVDSPVPSALPAASPLFVSTTTATKSPRPPVVPLLAVPPSAHHFLSVNTISAEIDGTSFSPTRHRNAFRSPRSTALPAIVREVSPIVSPRSQGVQQQQRLGDEQATGPVRDSSPLGSSRAQQPRRKSVSLAVKQMGSPLAAPPVSSSHGLPSSLPPTVGSAKLAPLNPASTRPAPVYTALAAVLMDARLSDLSGGGGKDKAADSDREESPEPTPPVSARAGPSRQSRSIPPRPRASSASIKQSGSSRQATIQKAAVASAASPLSHLSISPAAVYLDPTRPSQTSGTSASSSRSGQRPVAGSGSRRLLNVSASKGSSSFSDSDTSAPASPVAAAATRSIPKGAAMSAGIRTALRVVRSGATLLQAVAGKDDVKPAIPRSSSVSRAKPSKHK